MRRCRRGLPGRLGGGRGMLVTLLALVAGGAAGSVVGCDGARSPGAEPPEPAPARSVAVARDTASDATRRPRLVSLAPSVTELVFAVGAGDRLVGATSACDHPAAARAVPRVGDYSAPSVEMILSLAPDVVLVPAEGTLRGPYEMLRARGVRVEPIWVRSFDELFAACERVGALAGKPARGRALADSLRARVQAVRARVEGSARPRVLVVVDQNPLVAAGPGTFLDTLLRAAGGQNALETGAGSWPQLGRESVLALRPAVVIDAGMVSSTPAGARPSWAPPTARVVRIDPDLLVRPGPRLVDGLEALSRALHPRPPRPAVGKEKRPP